MMEWEDGFVRIQADRKAGLMVVQWKAFPPSAHYRTMLDKVVDLIREHRLRYFLTDQRWRGPILHEDERWLLDDWTPRFAALGVERAAVVQSEDYFNRVAVERFVEQALPRVSCEVRYFHTPKEAEDWIRRGTSTTE
jgi:hypothetical protein